MNALTVKSSAFQANNPIPKKYTCKGEGINPPLSIDGVPKETKTLALLMDDPDAPRGTFDHWVVWNIPASTKNIGEKTIPGTEGLNGMRKKGYTGPCPPSGTHTGTSSKFTPWTPNSNCLIKQQKERLKQPCKGTFWRRAN
jgi:hypothetical protein